MAISVSPHSIGVSTFFFLQEIVQAAIPVQKIGPATVPRRVSALLQMELARLACDRSDFIAILIGGGRVARDLAF